MRWILLLKIVNIEKDILILTCCAESDGRIDF